MRLFPHFSQFDSADCGPSCLRIISKYYGREIQLGDFRELCNIGKEGVSVLGICNAAEAVGFSTAAVQLSFETLQQKATLPCVAYWEQNHFVVIYKITSKYVYISDPGSSRQKLTIADFLKSWIIQQDDAEPSGVVMLLQPLPSFFEKKEQVKSGNDKKDGLRYVYKHLFIYKKILIQVAIGMAFATVLQLLMPFLTQSLVDWGIYAKDVSFIYLILAGQLAIFAGQIVIDFIQNWLLLYMGARVNVTMVSEFLNQIMQMPLKYFDTKLSGDLLQRIEDHKRIEKFLTSRTLSMAFHMVVFISFSAVLFVYDLTIFLVFILASCLYLAWIIIFYNKRKVLDFKRFRELSKNQSQQIEIINGMQDIKLHNAERLKRSEWRDIQARLFSINIQYQSVEQYQRLGAKFINNLKNILITFIAAKYVMQDQLSFGQMLAIQFIIGELNQPLNAAIEFIQSYQEAKISLDRVGEIQDTAVTLPVDAAVPDEAIVSGSIYIRNLSFRYGGTHFYDVLKDVNLTIPKGKVTAIVGLSGSGKTTLLKLLMKFYEPVRGEILVDDRSISTIDERLWREKCGSVLQDGYIFSDTIAKNIALGYDVIDEEKLQRAIHTANISGFIDSLPLGLTTKIGPEGMGLSQGQKQRLLIARAVYKDPEYLFFDEATNALDANNEKTIISNLNNFFKGKTVVVVAHRLSTVKDADNIYVMQDGDVVESGNHQELVFRKGFYYTLIQNQLELG